MDAQQFLAEFGHIANAPNGVTRLRELVLSLAFKGELCSPSDGASNTLLDDIERQRLDFNGETRKQRLTRQSNAAGKFVGPYEIPKHWSWVSLSTVGHTWGQKKPDDSFVYIDVSSIDNKAGVLSQSPEVISPSAAPSRARKIVKKGTLVYSTVRPYLLNIAIIDRDFDSEPIASTAFAIVHPWEGISGRYLYFYLRSPIFVRYVESVQIGMAYPAISDEKFYSGVVPLPPTEEQSRIVAKVDELMALCDKLEAQQLVHRKLQNNLRHSTLQAVASATSPHELQTTWVRLADNFGRLFHAPEDVAAFKGLILDLAVSGELLSIEHHRAATGADLLDAIAAKRLEWSRKSVDQEQKEAVAMLKKLRTQQASIPDAALPEHWAWASLLQVSQAVVDCHNKTAPYVSEGIHLIRTTDIRNGRMDLSSTRKISEETYAYWARRMPPKGGDIFFTREAPMGEAAIVPNGEKVCLGQRSMLIRLFPDLFSNRFLLCVIQSPSFQSRMIEAAIGMTVKHLRVGGVEDLVVPVPPKAEQDRIVAIVDALFRICDHYADQLSRKQHIATNLAASAVSGLTGIAVEQEEEPMKAPQTELIAPLRLGIAPDVNAQAPLATILARHNGETSAKDLWQRFGGEIDAFYAQLKTEVAHGWILEPASAEMREKPAETMRT
ncbi:restriction endonuclease subunit S [Janthinobacterium fluminis]|uniref:Restriction endonuclease subunit S n=1 Tax=Janthinobacterium fluminis TaxID=2987524 RepID=A0ABT5K9D8_9BURK|nr:restriction endonuclease subunit S [Janthinobacterium fluminis]MDC8760691.1 restriction endonuclease subunit S [Janthinobacterium fluminis]